MQPFVDDDEDSGPGEFLLLLNQAWHSLLNPDYLITLSLLSFNVQPFVDDDEDSDYLTCLEPGSALFALPDYPISLPRFPVVLVQLSWMMMKTRGTSHAQA